MNINAKIRKAKNGYILTITDGNPPLPGFAPQPMPPGSCPVSNEMVFTSLDECMSYIRGFIGE